MSDDPQQQNKIDDYILIAPVASGKSAIVWEVMHEQSNQMFAMKLLNQNAMLDPDEKALLKQEAKIGALMEHPNLIRNHGVVIRKTECYLLMDLFKTPNLKVFINSGREVIEANFEKLVEGICLGMGHMHSKGWVHKDLKPDNILLNRAGEVRIIDFSLAVRAAGGLAKLMGGGKGPIRGTRTYLAPETIRKEASTPATDIYSIGITLFECLTGTTPFKGDTPQDLLKKHIGADPPLPSMRNERVTPEMDRLILKMLAKKPKDRFASMEELLTEFKKCRVFKQEEVDEEALKAEEEKRRKAEAAGSDLNEAQTEELRELMYARRDSRTDAQIQAIIRGNPAMQRQYAIIQKEQKEAEAKRAADLKRRAESLKKGEKSSGSKEAKPEKKKRKKKRRPPQQPAPVAYQSPPGYAVPPQMPYGMPQPGMPIPPQPGFPAAPMQPGMPMPQVGASPQGVPHQQPAPAPPPQAAPPAAGAPVPPPAQPPAAPKPAPAEKPKEDMDFMTELPDIE